MEEIKVGEYVRTEIGTIGKVKSISYAGSGIRYYGEELTRNYYTIAYNGDTYGRFDDNGITNHSFNILDLIEDEDIAVLEYKSPKYKKRVIRRFEVFKIDDDIRFENAYCNFYCKVGDKRITDTICKNIKVKSVVTKEQFENIEYKI